ncbi:MFS transporter [Streptomyces roseoverticillatus]|uniref:MFS transporter n=1 Tax=Streptomyces roseoverticillatus TaxID=66429 RepID=UPI0012FF4EAC
MPEPADRFGRRRVFAAGGVLFAAASRVSALVADGVVLLDVARGAAGAGAAAALLTGGSSLLAAAFDGAARTRVFAAVGIVTGGGLALGAMAAGALADALGRRSCGRARWSVRPCPWRSPPCSPAGPPVRGSLIRRHAPRDVLIRLRTHSASTYAEYFYVCTARRPSRDGGTRGIRP